VTRHGRVVFYDYDELCLLTECNFRAMPPARDYDDEVADQPWFSVAENDIFPEEFRRFLWFPAALRSIFEEHHGWMFTPDYWRELQERTAAGELIDFYPYDVDQRFHRDLAP
jgi:isocitrate dehydrogenase kinase/phosphatase